MQFNDLVSHKQKLFISIPTVEKLKGEIYSETHFRASNMHALYKLSQVRLGKVKSV